MGTSTLLLLAVCVTGVFCAPLHIKNSDLCAKVCLPPSSDNLVYNASYTYEYEFVGKSRVVAGQQIYSKSEMDVIATIALGWVNPCNAVIHIKNARVLGETDITSQLLTNHPLMVGIQNGLVTDVCADPNDEPTSLNFKKGIISQIQNSLPSFSTEFNDRTFAEKDILGTCPTSYSMRAMGLHGRGLIIVKNKNHKLCKSKHSNLMTKLALPLWASQVATYATESYSLCMQEVNNQMVTAVKCEDVNDFYSLLDEKKMHIKAMQASSLKFLRRTRGVPGYGGLTKKTSIEFEVGRESQNSKFTKIAINILKEVCQVMKVRTDYSIPQRVSKLISFLYRTPDDDLFMIKEQILARKICTEVNLMETLYIDSLLSMRSSGAVRILFDQIKHEKLTGLRPYVFAAQLHLISNPSIELIKVAYSAFDNPNMPAPIMLAVGSLVKKYCHQQSDCLRNEHVQQIYEALSRGIISSCSNSMEENSDKMKALVALKVAGNAGNFDESFQNVILSCLQSEQADLPVRVEAVQSFRQSKLSSQIIASLSDMVLDDALPNEVRIACYLAVYDKAAQWQLEEILDVLKQQLNCHVRSFVLSHMRNLQLTENPDLQNLRYSLLPLVIPQDFRRDATKYSGDYELSKYWKELNAGAAVAGNVVYSASSLIPRQMRLNLTSSYFENINNPLEIGLRMEDIEALMTSLFSPEGLLSTEVFSQAVRKTLALVQEHGVQLLHHDKLREQLQNIYDQVLSHISKSEGSETKTKLDAFIRLFGEEFGFISLAGYPKNILSSQMVTSVMETSMEELATMFMQALDKDYSSLYLVQFRKENFISTVQGIPIQIKVAATVMSRWYAASRLEKGEYNAKIRPQVMGHFATFVGYSLGGKAGIRANYTSTPQAHVELKVTETDGNIDIQLDAPPKQQLLYMERNIYMFSKKPGQEDVISVCNKQMQMRQARTCSPTMENSFGIRFCETEAFLGKPQPACFTTRSVRQFDLDKVQHDLPIAKFRVMKKVSETEGSLRLELVAPAAAKPSLGMLDLQYNKHNNNGMVLMKLQTPSQGVKLFKASLTRRQTDAGSQYELVLFSANKDQINAATDKIAKFVTGLGRVDETVGKVSFTATTMNQLRKYILANIYVESNYALVPLEDYNDFMVPVIMLERFEFDVGMHNYMTRNHIRWAQNINKVSVKSKTDGPKGLILKFDSSVLWEGSLQDEDADAKIVAEIKTSKNSYNLDSQMHFTQAEKNFTVHIQKPNKKKVAMIQARVKHNKLRNLETVMEIDIPSKMKPYQMELFMKETGFGVRMINFMLKKENKPLYSMFGPVKYSWQNSIFEQKSNLTLKLNREDKYIRLESSAYKSPVRQDLLVKVFKTNNILLGTLDVEQKSDWSSQSIAFFVPRLIDSSAKLKLTPNMAAFSTELSLSQYGKQDRKMQANGLVSFIDQQVDAELCLDANSHLNERIIYTGKYNWGDEYSYITSRGALTVFGDKFKYIFNSNLLLHPQDADMPDDLKVELINNNNEHMHLMMKYGNLRRTTGDEFSDNYELTGALTTFHNQQYEVNSVLKLIDESAESFHQTIYKISLSSPKYRVVFGRKYDNSANPNSIHAQETGLYSQASLMVKEEDKLICDMNLQMKGKEVDISLGALIKDYKVHLHSSPQKALYFSVNENGVKVVDAECDIRDPTDWKVVISSKNLKKSRSFSTPLSSMTELESGKLISKGVVAFDIFKNAKPLTIEVTLLEKLQMKYILQAIMNVPNLPKKPKLVAELGMVSNVNVLQVSLHDDIKAPVIARLEAHQKEVTPDAYNIQAKISVPEETIEVSALVQRHSSLSCMGRSVNGTVSTRTHGPVTIRGSACGPAYLELGVKRPTDTAMALVKLGMKSYASVRFAVDLVYDHADTTCAATKSCHNCKCLDTWSLYENKWMTKQNIFLVGAKLKHAQLVQLLAKCSRPLITQYKTDLWHPSVMAAEKVVMTFINDTRRAGNMIIPKTLEVQPNLKKFSLVVVEKVEKLPQLFGSWWSTLIADVKNCLKKVSDYLANLRKEISDYVIEKIDEIIQYIFGYKIRKWEMAGLEKMSDIIANKLTKLEAYVIDRLTVMEMPKIYSGIWNLIKNFLIDHREGIIKDLAYLNNNFVPKAFRMVSDFIVTEIDNWLMNLNNPYVGTLLAPLLSGSTGVSCSKQGGWLALTLPVTTPVASVSAAVANLGIPARMLALTLPPWATLSARNASRPLARLSPTDIVTFNGLAIPVIPSECKILMIKDEKVAIEAVIFSRDHMELDVLYPNFITKVVLRKNMPIKVVPLVKGQQHADVVIYRVDPTEVVITAPGLKAWLTNKSVLFESSRSRPEGILGCRDNETTTDAPSHLNPTYISEAPITSHHASNKSALHFLKKYRNDENCQIYL